MKKTFVKIAAVATMLVSMSGIGFAYTSYGTYQYDHAQVGRKFDKNAMVTHCTYIRYDRVEKDTIYRFEYGDGTIVDIRVSQYGNVLHIQVFKP